MVAARSLYQRENPEVRVEDLLIYVTTQTHSLGLKAGLVLGVKVRAIDVKLEDQFSLRGEALRNTLQEDKAKGLHPFIISMLDNASLYGPSQLMSSCSRNSRLDILRSRRQYSRNQGRRYEQITFYIQYDIILVQSRTIRRYGFT